MSEITTETVEKIVNKHSHSKPQNITKEKLKAMLPKGASHEVTDRVMELIENAENDTGVEQYYLEEQFLTHIGVIKKFKVSLEDYINAVKYVTLVGNLSNRKAWEIVFPDRLARAEEKIRINKEKEARGEKFVKVNIDSHVSNYNKTPLVVELRSRASIALDIVLAPVRQRMAMKLVELADGIAAPNAYGEPQTVTPTVQETAAEAFVREFRPVEPNKHELKIGFSEEVIAAQKSLADAVSASAEQMKRAFEAGGDIRDIQKLGIKSDTAIDVEVD